MYGWGLFIAAIAGIFVIDKIPLIPRSWTHKIRVSLGLLAFIIAIYKVLQLGNLTDPKLKIVATVGLGAASYVAVDRIPIISNVIPDQIKTATKVGVILMAAAAVIVTLRQRAIM